MGLGCLVLEVVAVAGSRLLAEQTLRPVTHEQR
jgi:hypothetical protein